MTDTPHRRSWIWKTLARFHDLTGDQYNDSEVINDAIDMRIQDPDMTPYEIAEALAAEYDALNERR